MATTALAQDVCSACRSTCARRCPTHLPRSVPVALSPRCDRDVCVQVNLSTLLTGLGDGSLLCPTTSALGATVARSDAYDSAMQELARVQTENVNLRAEVDCLVHVRAENVSLRAEVHRAREQVKRSAQSVLVELDATSTSCETMQARAEHEQQLKLQQSQLQHERRTGPVPKPTSLHWAQWRE